jgi:hypothetical protein
MPVVCRRVAFAVPAVLWLAPAGAQTQPTPPPAPAQQDFLNDLKALVDNLDSEILQQRLDAAKALRERPEINLRTIEGVIRTATLSPEQHRQLVSIAWERFKSEPRPAMGIQSSYNQRGAVLQSVTRGFPAESVLRAGDRIEVADGVKLDEFDTLRHVILSRDPGDEMALSIVREGAVLNVKVTLGRFDELRGQPLTEFSLLTAFRQFRARDYFTLGPKEEPLDSGLAPEAWAMAELLAQDTGDVTYIDHGETDGSQSPMPVTAAGEPRQEPRIARSPRINARMDEAQVELQMLNAFRQQLERDIEANKAKLNDPNLPESAKDALRALNVRNERHLVIYRDLIRQRTDEQRRRR